MAEETAKSEVALETKIEETAGKAVKTEATPIQEDKINEEVPVRKSPWTNREERAQFFKGKQKEVESEPENEDEPLSLTPKELATRIQDAVKEYVKPIESSLQDRHDQSDIQEFFSNPKNESFRKYEAQARKFIKNPAYANADLGLIFKGLAYDDAFAEGATRGVKAEDRTARTKTGGTQSSNKGSTTAEQIRTASPKEFEKIRQDVLAGKKLE